MKIAAKRFDWCPKTWAMQTEAIAEAMLTGGRTADELADAYRNPPPPDRVFSDAKMQPATQALPQAGKRLKSALQAEFGVFQKPMESPS